MKRWILLATLLCSVAALAQLACGSVSTRVMRTVLERNMAGDAVDDLPDGLHVGLCGAGGPLPSEERSGPCVAVVAGERIFIIDAGTGGVRNLQRLFRWGPGRIQAVFLTHFHSDHIDGLGELGMQRWVNGSHTSPLPVYGGPGVEQIVNGFNMAYAQDAVYRTAHHGEAVVPSSGTGLSARGFELPPPGETVVVYEDDGLQVRAFAVQHAPVEPAVGYRFDYRGRSVAISGDTTRSESLIQASQGVDLLVHEALSFELVGIMQEAAEAAGNEAIAKIAVDILDYHADPAQVAEVATAVGAGHLLFYHVVPPLPLPGLEGIFLEGVSDNYDGGVTLGRDGSWISLPAGVEDIDVMAD
ncbi:MAG: MBL fold metallo-hydrolase [Myxococcota bacterium]